MHDSVICWAIRSIRGSLEESIQVMNIGQSSPGVLEHWLSDGIIHEPSRDRNEVRVTDRTKFDEGYVIHLIFT